MWCMAASMTSLLEHNEKNAKPSECRILLKNYSIKHFFFILIMNGQKMTENIIFNVNLLRQKKYLIILKMI